MPVLSVLLMDSVNYFRKHVMSFCVLVLPFAFISYLLTYNMNKGQEANDVLLYLLCMLTIYPFYKCAILFYIAYSFDDKRVPFTQLYKISSKTWLAFTLMNIYVGVCLLFGFILLILPGLYLMARFSFTEIYCVLYQKDAKESMKKSWEDSQNNYWTLFQGLVAIFLVTRVGVWLINYVFSVVGLESEIVSAGVFMLDVLFSIISTIFVFRVFTVDTTKLKEIQSIGKDDAI